MPPPLPLAELCGPLLIAYMLNWGLFGTLSVQLYLYYRAFPADRRIIKALVYTVYVFELVQTVLLTHDAFEIFAKGFGDVSALDRVHFDWYTAPLTTGIVAFIGQAFYAYRIYVVSKSYWIPILILMLSLTSNICAFVDAGLSRAAGVLPTAHTNETVVISISLGGAALTDVLIALSFTYYLYKCDTGFNRTHASIVRLIRLTIETGSLTALLALTNLTLFLVFPGKPFLFTPAAILPKMYANTMLAVLNSRFVIVGGRGYVESDRSMPWQSLSLRDREGSNGHGAEGNTGRGAAVVTISRGYFADGERGEEVEMKDVRV
ncbi:hypothetical protein FB45DRAFT_1060588 [Roridomyces roridus]|uniref:DUF6534 domain-containing protein n=1 Tax=Roridomyces roridus TaxID=1738132 RepID=A0AAD7FL39_9AGAR|nr:hypothetical protein FB45DRAFT_1060588 [Roridomyces roridus]